MNTSRELSQTSSGAIRAQALLSSKLTANRAYYASTPSFAPSRQVLRHAALKARKAEAAADKKAALKARHRQPRGAQ